MYLVWGLKWLLAEICFVKIADSYAELMHVHAFIVAGTWLWPSQNDAADILYYYVIYRKRRTTPVYSNNKCDISKIGNNRGQLKGVWVMNTY